MASSPAPVPASKTAHLAFIDGLRGFAILWVLLYHGWEEARLPADHWWNPLFCGYAGVNLFLLLSGFCLYWPLVKPRNPSPEPTLREFAMRRAHRLLPPYYIALALCVAGALLLHAHGKSWPDGPYGDTAQIWRAAGWHALMLHNLIPGAIWTLNGPFWSLALEVNLYVAMPLLVVAARRFGIKWAVALAAAVTIVYRVVCHSAVGGVQGWLSLPADAAFALANSLAGHWLEFALGMWAAALVAQNAADQTRLPLAGLALGAGIGAAWLSEHFTRYNPGSDALFGLSFFCLLLQASRPLKENQGRFALSAGRLLRGRALTWLGKISYSVYLIHLPLLKLMLRASGMSLQHDRTILLVSFGIFLPLIVLAAFVFHCVCERPFMNGPRPPSPGKRVVPALAALVARRKMEAL